MSQFPTNFKRGVIVAFQDWTDGEDVKRRVREDEMQILQITRRTRQQAYFSDKFPGGLSVYTILGSQSLAYLKRLSKEHQKIMEQRECWLDNPNLNNRCYKVGACIEFSPALSADTIRKAKSLEELQEEAKEIINRYR